MVRFIAKRLLIMIPTLVLISVISFTLIQLPPGNYLDTLIANMERGGDTITEAQVEAYIQRYSLDRPMHEQYFRWISNILLHGDFGQSFEYERPVNDIIWQRLALTLVVTVSSLLFSWAVSFPIGFYSAVKQHSKGDYFFTFLGFIGLATPNFLLALVLMYASFKYLGIDAGGLFSRAYIDAPWSPAKFVDMLKHLWIPMLIIGTSGSAGLIRVMRNNLLDELHKPYVIAARARGVSELKLLLKYPVRVALNPFLSTVGWLLPRLIGGSAITSVVLNLPTTGPVLLHALQVQDMFLAGSFTMLLAVLTVVGTLISDILLAALDPRVRFE